ncbi:MAG: phosphatidate cytidylyltransferase [Hydrogenophilales bacterium 28-61-23]|nr:MAG: phosphatidate cytidylyltransferase [Hydrogenophilales bacterium 28-61-23]
MTWFPLSIDRDALALVQGILGVLILGSVVAMLLKVWVAKRRPHALIDNIAARVMAWWAIALAVGLAFWMGRIGVCLLFAAASFVALREFVPAGEGRRGERVMALGAFYGALPLQFWLVWRGHDAWLTSLVPAYAFLVVPLIAVLAGEARDLQQRAAPLQWGLMLCVLGVSFVPALLTLEIPGYPGRNGYLLMFLLLVTQLGDVFQYIWGKLLGRHALAPAVSPSKTVEGFAGGVLSATVLGAGLAWMTPFTPVQAATIALGISLLGVLGGLTLSAIKRDRGIKDWGTLIVGHGGMLDRLDSLCFSAPAFYFIVRLGWG